MNDKRLSSPRQPYPGLRSFEPNETDLFFGREDCIDAMVDKLSETRFLAVLGASGSGKSSLVKTGLLAALRLGLMASAPGRWRATIFKPGGQPLRNLASALLGPDAPPEDVDLLRAYLRRGPRSLVEWLRDQSSPVIENKLLIVDQFEELFRYQDFEGREEAEAFVALLLFSARQRVLPIYVALTMRSEYLGASALIEGLVEAMNAGQYLIPRMTRGQCRDAIMGPAAVCDFDIDDGLVNRLLNDLEGFAPWEEEGDRKGVDQLARLARRADQLPVLQHALNRLWLSAVETVEREGTGRRIKLVPEDYAKIGGLQGALDRHADDILAAVARDRGPATSGLAEPIFQALTSGSGVADAVRRPTRLRNLIEICHGDEVGVRAVVDAFRASGVNFLTPHEGVPLEAGTYVDISHESLIRQWRKLSAWLETEAANARSWRHLSDAAALYARGQGGLLTGRSLETHLNWQKKAQPSAAWAARFASRDEYNDVVGFLEASRTAEDKRLTDEKRRRRRNAALAGAVVIAVVGFGAFSVYQQRENVIAENDRLRRKTATTEEMKRYLDDTIGRAQDGSLWSESGGYFSTLAAAAPHMSQELSSALAGRLGVQHAFGDGATDDIEVGDEELETGATGPFALRASDNGFVAVVDRATGTVLRGENFPSDQQPDSDAAHFISPDGRHVIVATENGPVVHWPAGAQRTTYALPAHLNLNQPSSIVFDDRSNRIALVQKERGLGSVLVVIDPRNGNRGGLVALSRLRSEMGAPTGQPLLLPERPIEAEGADDDSISVLAVREDHVLAEFTDKDEKSDLVLIDFDKNTVRVVVPREKYIRRFAALEGGAIPILVQGSTPDCADVEVKQHGNGEERPFRCISKIDASTGNASILVSSIPSTPATMDIERITSIEHTLLKQNDTLFGEWPFNWYIDEDEVAEDVLPGRDAVALTRWMRFPRTSDDARILPLERGKVLVEERDDQDRLKIVDLSGVTRTQRLNGAFAGELKSETLVSLNERRRDIGVADAKGGTLAAASDKMILIARNAQLFASDSAGRVREAINLTESQADLCGGKSGREMRELKVLDESRPLFIGLDRGDRVWGIAPGDGKSPDDLRPSDASKPSEMEKSPAAQAMVATCHHHIKATTILAVHADTGMAVLQTGPRELTLIDARTFSGLASREKNAAIRPTVLRTESTPKRAVFFRGGNALAVLLERGEIELFEDLRTPNLKRRLQAILPNATHFSGNSTQGPERLLIVSAGGLAVILDASTPKTRVVAAGGLPIRFSEDASLVGSSADSGGLLRLPGDAGLIRLLDDGVTVEVMSRRDVFHFRLPKVPAPEELFSLVAVRNVQTHGAESRELGMPLRLLEEPSQKEGPAARAPTLPLDVMCRLAFIGRVALAESADSSVADEDDETVDTANDSSPAVCSLSQSASTGSKLGWIAGASALLDEERGAPWTPSSSALLQAGLTDTLALRALAAKLAASDNVVAKAAAEQFPFRLKNPDAIVLPRKVNELVESGLADRELERLVLQYGAEPDPIFQRLKGAILSREIASEQSRTLALESFLLAERLSEWAGDGEAPIAARRRSQLARQLSAESVRTAQSSAVALNGIAIALPVPASPSPELPSEDVLRLRADLVALDKLTSRAPNNGGLELLRILVCLELADRLDKADPSAAASARREASKLLASGHVSPEGIITVGRVLWPSVKESADAAFVAAPVMSALEQSPIRGPNIAFYVELVDKLRHAAGSAGDERHFVDTWKPGSSAFSFSLTDVDTPERARGLAAAVHGRLKLMQTLSERNADRLDFHIHYAVTKYLAAIAYDRLVKMNKVFEQSELVEKLGKPLDNLGEAVIALQVARNKDEQNLDVLYALAEAQRRYAENFRQIKSGAAEAGTAAIRNYDILMAARRDGSWVTNVNLSSLLSSKAYVGRTLSQLYVTRAVQMPDAWPTSSTETVRLAFDALIFANESLNTFQASQDVRQEYTRGAPDYSVDLMYAAYPIGLLAGRGRPAAAAPPSITECEVLASHPYDPTRRTSGVEFENIDSREAVRVCGEAVAKGGKDPRHAYLLARALERVNPKGEEAKKQLDLYIFSVQNDYVIAFNNLSSADAADDFTEKEKLRTAFYQRVVKYNYAAVYPLFRDAVRDSRDKLVLAWLTAEAAKLGVPEAHIVMAETATPAAKVLHFLVAARLFDDVAPEKAEALREQAAAIPLSDGEREDMTNSARKWEPAGLVKLTDEMIEELRELVK